MPPSQFPRTVEAASTDSVAADSRISLLLYHGTGFRLAQLWGLPLCREGAWDLRDTGRRRPESKSCVSESLRCFGNCGRTPADAHLSVPLFPCQLMGLVSMSPIGQLGGQGRETQKAEFIVKINNNYCKDNLYDQCYPPREDGGLSLLTSAGQLAPNPSIRTRK